MAADKVTDEALHALARTGHAGQQGSRAAGVSQEPMVTSGISCAETTTEVAQKAWQKR